MSEGRPVAPAMFTAQAVFSPLWVRSHCFLSFFVSAQSLLL